MKNEETLIKLKEARAEALANSSNVKIGMRELNTAIKALEIIVSIENQSKEKYFDFIKVAGIKYIWTIVYFI